MPRRPPVRELLGGAAPVIGHPQVETSRTVFKPHDGLGRTGVLQRVRQGLLNDAEGGQIHALRKIVGTPLEDYVDRQPGLARLFDQLVQAIKSGLWGLIGLVLTSQHAGETAHLG